MLRSTLLKNLSFLLIAFAFISCQKTPVNVSQDLPESFRKYKAPYGIVWEELLKVLEFDLKFRIDIDDFHDGFVSTRWKKHFDALGNLKYRNRINATVKVAPDGLTLVTVNHVKQLPLEKPERTRRKKYKTMPSDMKTEQRVLVLLQRRLNKLQKTK